MPNRNYHDIFDLLVRVLPVMHKKIHRDIFKATIEEAGESMAPHHLMILKMLRQSEPLNMSEIGEEIAISQSQMTHSTDKLIKLGMIERGIDTEDRRRVYIRLTDKGERCLEKMDPIMRNRMETKLSVLNDKDMAKLAASLENVAEIFNKLNWD